MYHLAMTMDVGGADQQDIVSITSSPGQRLIAVASISVSSPTPRHPMGAIVTVIQPVPGGPELTPIEQVAALRRLAASIEARECARTYAARGMVKGRTDTPIRI